MYIYIYICIYMYIWLCLNTDCQMWYAGGLWPLNRHYDSPMDSGVAYFQTHLSIANNQQPQSPEQNVTLFALSTDNKKPGGKICNFCGCNSI